MKLTRWDTHIAPRTTQEIRQKSNRVTPGKFMRSFHWSSRQRLKMTRMASFWGGIFAKSAKKRKFFFGRTTGLFAKKTIHSKVFQNCSICFSCWGNCLFIFLLAVVSIFFLRAGRAISAETFSFLKNEKKFMLTFFMTWTFLAIFHAGKVSKNGSHPRQLITITNLTN